MSELTDMGKPVTLASYLQALTGPDGSKAADTFSRAHRVRLLYLAVELRCIAEENPGNSEFVQAIADLIEAAVES